MGSDQFEIKHIADLAQLSLERSEEESLSEDLAKILAYVDQLQKVDTKGVEDQVSISELCNKARKDEKLDSKKDVKKSQVEKIKSQFPQSRDDFVEIIRILER